MRNDPNNTIEMSIQFGQGTSGSNKVQMVYGSPTSADGSSRLVGGIRRDCSGGNNAQLEYIILPGSLENKQAGVYQVTVRLLAEPD